MNVEVEIIEPQTELIEQAKKIGVSEAVQLALAEEFAPYLQQARDWKEQAEALVVTDPEDEAGMKKARDMRLQLRKLRIGAEKVRKEKKDASLKFGQAVDSVAKTIKEIIEPAESHLQAQEDFAETFRKSEIARLAAERKLLLMDYDFDTSSMNLGEMPQQVFDQVLIGAKTTHENNLKAEAEKQKRLEEEAEAERKRIAEEKAEQARIAEENARLRKEQEERDAALEKERQEHEAALQAERDAAEKKLAEERAEREKELAAERAKALEEKQEREAAEVAERQKREAAEKQRQAEEDARLEAERKEREKAEAEAKALRDAEEKRQQEERDRLKAEEDKKQKALQASDKEKLSFLIEHVASIQLKSPEGRACLNQVVGVIRKTVSEM